MAETPIHVTIAEEVVGKVKKAARERLSITSKSSYSIIEDEHSWICRLTPKVFEANKKRLTEEQLDAAGLHGGAKPMHRPHHLGARLALASVKDDAERKEMEKELEGGGLEEVAHAVEVGAKPSKAE